MHVLHLIKTSEGAAWALNLLHAVKKKYPDIKFSVIIPKGGKNFDGYLEVCEHVVNFDYDLNMKFLRKGQILKKIIEDLNPDIIHSWFTQTTLYSRLFLRKFTRPKIYQVVGPAHLEIAAFKWGDILSGSKDDYWIATSQYIYDHYKKARVSPEKLFLNYAYIDTEKFLTQAKLLKQRDLRKEYNIPNSIKIIGTASYIYPPKFFQKNGIKGHEILLESFKILLEKRDDVVLFIAGGTFGKDRGYEKKLKAKAAAISTDKIFFTGPYKHVNEVISNYDVFVYLSKSENLGGVYESLLLEIPTISSDRGALPELVINGETGYNVGLDNSEFISEKIELLFSQKNYYKENGKRKVRSIFDKEKIIDKTFHIYHTVLERNKVLK